MKTSIALPAEHVLVLTASGVDGVAYQFPASAGEESEETIDIPAGTTIGIGQFGGTKRFDVIDCIYSIVHEDDYDGRLNSDTFNDGLTVAGGTMELKGDATVFDDLRFPSNSSNRIAGQEPTVEATSGLLLFSKTQLNTVFALVQLPHSWKEGTTIYPHIHWQKADGGDTNPVVWEVKYKHIPIGGVMDAAWTTEEKDNVVGVTPDDGTADKHLITAFTGISMAGKTISHCILFWVSRLGNDAGDTYDDDARFMEFDVHYEMDTLGSDEEFTK